MKKLGLLLPFFLNAAFAQSAKIEPLKPLVKTRTNIVHQMTYRGRAILGQGQIVAVLDSGISSFNPHLQGKIAVNRGEKADGKDNDGNGLVDDLYGWNFLHRNGILVDDHGHGTHVSGTIVGPKYGIAPGASIVPIKVTVTPKGDVSDQHLVDGIKYAVDKGARIINLSLGGIYVNMPVTSYVIKEAIEYARKKNVLVVVSAGNNGIDITGQPVYPANINSENLITVCATDDEGLRAPFSNFSQTAVHLCAPGVDIASAHRLKTAFNKYANEFQLMSGTSMATPMVTGVAALLWSMEPNLKAREIKDIILTAARKRAHLTPYLFYASQTGGVLDALGAVNELKRRTGVK